MTEKAETMELKDFISTSLKEIILAVHDVQNDEDIKKTGALINPRKIAFSNFDPPIFKTDSNRTSDFVDTIEFDVAVTVTSGAETKAGISVFGGAFGFGAGGKTDETNGVASRLKFSVPIVLPVSTP